MIVGRERLFFVTSLLFAVLFSFYSYRGFERARAKEPVSFMQPAAAIVFDEALSRTWEHHFIKEDITPQRLGDVGDRNAFARYMEKKAGVKLVVTLPEPESIVEPEAVIVPQEVTIYLYRGIVVLGDRMSYVIEREKDKKTYSSRNKNVHMNF